MIQENSNCNVENYIAKDDYVPYFHPMIIFKDISADVRIFHFCLVGNTKYSAQFMSKRYKSSVENL